MMTNDALLTGLVIGLSVAVPIGPMGLLCIQRTLSSGLRVGVSTGLGAATVNVLYGALIILSLDSLGPLLAQGGRLLNFASGLFLLRSAAGVLRRRPAIADQPPAAPPFVSPVKAYGSAILFNAANPLSPMLMVALFAPVMHRSVPDFDEAVVLLLGMFVAAVSWWMCLSSGVALLRSRLSPQLLVIVNQVAGLLLTIYGAVALARSAGL